VYFSCEMTTPVMCSTHPSIQEGNGDDFLVSQAAEACRCYESIAPYPHSHIRFHGFTGTTLLLPLLKRKEN